MKNLILILTLFLASLTTSSLFSQNHSRALRLIKEINEGDYEKYSKLRAKIDAATFEKYESEILVCDAFLKIHLKKDITAVKDYFKECYDASQKFGGNQIKDIFREAEGSFETFTNNIDKMILELLNKSDSKLYYSVYFIKTINETNYKMLADIKDSITIIKEKEMFEDINKEATIEKLQTYMDDFFTHKNCLSVATKYNELLLEKSLKENTLESLTNYFDNKSLVDYYTQNNLERANFNKAQRAYDELLFNDIQIEKSRQAIYKRFEYYSNNAYLNNYKRVHELEVEYKKDSVDWFVASFLFNETNDISLLKNFLGTHNFKKFKDIAIEIRNSLIDTAVMVTPFETKSYSGKRLVKETLTSEYETCVTDYVYNGNGFVLEKVKTIKNGNNEIRYINNYEYNDNVRCYEERASIKNKSLTASLYTSSFLYDAQGNLNVKQILYEDKKYSVENYNSAGFIVSETNYEGGNITSVTNYNYNINNDLSEKNLNNNNVSQSNPFVNISWKYNYNKYGYLENIEIKKVKPNGDKEIENINYHYDVYGNEIDPNYTYEYDEGGYWYCKRSKENQNELHRMTITYKQP